jgi:hypothetical protein
MGTDEDELDMLAQRSPEIGKVVGLLKELSADEVMVSSLQVNLKIDEGI